MAYGSFGLIGAATFLILQLRFNFDSEALMSNYKDVDEAEEKFHERELADLNGAKFHRELAVIAALEYCAEEGRSPPPWAVREAADLLVRLLKLERTRKRGRAGSCIARYTQDMWDVERWDAVEEIRRIRNRSKHELNLLRELPTGSHLRHREHQGKMQKWLRHGVFECASMYLVGRDARASAQTIRKSHREVKRRAGDGPKPDRYFLFDERFLRKIGLPGLQDRKKGTKTFPLYDLKP